MNSSDAIDIILSGIDEQGLKELSQQGIDHIYPDWGRTALGLAISFHKAESAVFLLEHGANPNAFGEEGVSPLEDAYLSRDARLFSLLLLFGANPDLKATGGYSIRETLAICGALDFLTHFNGNE